MNRRVLAAAGALTLFASALAVAAAASPAAATAASSPGRPGHPGAVAAARSAPARHDVAALRSSVHAQLQQALSRTTPAPDPATAALPALPDGRVQVDVTGAAADIRSAVEGLGGTVLTHADGISSVRIAKSQLDELARHSGISRVSAPVRGYPQGVVSQGVAKSGANQWQAAGRRGAGVKIAIVDGGFAGLSAEQAAGNLPRTGSGLSYTNVNCPGGPDTPQHGTAVAEIVHQMAPSASLYLYCIFDTAGFAAAANDIIARKIPIATSSLGFPGDSRGDGTGAAGSAAATVKKAAQSGVFWIQSAGNNAQEHWSGTLTDADNDGLVDVGCVNGLSGCQQADAFFVPAGGSASATLKWDAWPSTSSTDVMLVLYGYTCDASANCTPINPDSTGQPTPKYVLHSPGPPTLTLDVDNTTSQVERWDVVIGLNGGSQPSVHFDLSYWGEVADPSYLAYTYPGLAAADSVTEPASSPYAFAVGAADVADGSLETFSSRGPTIDGRVKPEMTGWDCTSSNLSEFVGAFCGTSAAAPHVAGAAALAKSADSALTPAGLKAFLLARANDGNPITPAQNGAGAGNLTLGFFDVLPSNSFFADIDWLTDQKITTGYPDGGFHPVASVSRQAMAAFLYTMANPGTTPPPCTADAFPDVSQSATFCPQVTWLSKQAITAGYPDGGFHPADPVSRQAMAAFLYRFANPGTTPPPCSTDAFTDVAAGDPFCPAVQWLVQQGVTTGYPDGGYHPAAAVSRQAMAAFLHRFPARAP